MEKKVRLITKEQSRRLASWMRSIGYILTMATFGLIGSSLGPVLPNLAAQVSIPINTISLIFTARAAGFLTGAFFSGRIFDRRKAHLFLVACFLIQSMILAFTPFITNFWLLVGVLFLSGITLGSVVVGATTFLVWEHAENPAPWVSTQSFLNGVGNFLSPLVIALVVNQRGEYARSYWLFALASIIVALIFFYTPSPEIRESKSGQVETQQPQTGRRLVYLIAFIFLLYTGAEVTYNSWVFSVASSAYAFSDTAARLLNSLFWGALAVGRIFVGVFSRRFRPSRILQVSFIGAVLSFVSAIIFPGSGVMLWIASISAGFFMAVIFPTLTLYAEKHMRLTSSMTGMFFMATSVGGMLLPWLAGQTFVFLSPHWVVVVVAASLLGGFMIFSKVKMRLEKTKIGDENA